MSKVTVRGLNAAARATLTAHGITQAAWRRAHFGSSATWRGDRCGCPDDRCIGHHHDEYEGCLCLAALIAEQMTGEIPRPSESKQSKGAKSCTQHN